MSGARSGCKSIVQQHAPMVVYFHHAAHRLNLAVVPSCNIQPFKTAESCIGDIARFFKFSAKRQHLLDKVVDLVNSMTRTKKL